MDKLKHKSHKTPGRTAKRIRQQGALDRLYKRLPVDKENYTTAQKRELEKLERILR